MAQRSNTLSPPRRPNQAESQVFLVWGSIVLGFFILNLPFAIWPLQIQGDEHYYTVGAAKMMATGDFIVPLDLADEARLRKPPLAYYYIAAGVTLFGQSVWATKVFWLISATAALAVTFRLARVAGASLTGAAVAIAFLAGHRAFFRSATQHIPDMPLLLGCAISLTGFAALLAGQGGRGRPLLYQAAYGGIAFAVLAKGALAPAMLLAWFGARLLRRPAEPFPPGEWRFEILSALLASLAIGWWFALAWLAEPSTFQAQFLGDQVGDKVRLTLLSILGNLRKLTTDIIGPGLAFFLALFLARPWALWRLPGWRTGPVLLLLLWVGIVFVIFSFANVLYERYVLPSLPAAAVLLGLAADRLPCDGLAIRMRRSVRAALSLAASAGLVAGLILALNAWPLTGTALLLGAILAYGALWTVASGLPTLALAGLLGAAYPLVFVALLPVHIALGTPTCEQRAAEKLLENDHADDHVWVIGSWKTAGRIGIMSGGVAHWNYPAEIETLPEYGPAIVLADDAGLAGPLEAHGFVVDLCRSFSLDNFEGLEIVAALRAGDFAQAGREGGRLVLLATRR